MKPKEPYTRRNKIFLREEVVRPIPEEISKLNIYIRSEGEIDETPIIKKLKELFSQEAKKRNLKPRTDIADIGWSTRSYPVAGKPEERPYGIWWQPQPYHHGGWSIAEENVLWIGIKIKIDRELPDIRRRIEEELKEMGYENVQIISPEYIGERWKNKETIYV